MIRGQGMPSMRHHDPGNLYIKFDVEFPQTIPRMNLSQRKMLKKITSVESYKFKRQTDEEQDVEAMVIDDEEPEKNGEEELEGGEGEEDPWQLGRAIDDEAWIRADPEAKKQGAVAGRRPPRDVQDPAFPNDPRRRVPVTLEDHFVEKVDQNSQSHLKRATMKVDEEEGGERVQCASQ